MRQSNVKEYEQSVYMLEYGRRKMKICADTFLDLARILGEDEEASEKELYHLRSDRVISSRLSEGRRGFAGNFREIADMMKDACEETVRFMNLGKRRQKQVIRGLAGEGILAKELYLVQHGNGQTEISVMLSAKNGSIRTVEEAADYLSVLLDVRLVSARRNPYYIGKEPFRYFFREEPGYLFMTGMAKAVKETEQVSGDNFAFFEAGDGNMTVILSDGMGSGEEACRDSETVADMAEGFLETGITPQMAVGLVNSAVLSERRENRPSTLDLCSIDLYEGKCMFLKNGAAASFIKRGGAVETISAGSLPLGCFENIRPESAERELSDGDLVILVSDGVIESWNSGGEEKLRRYLSEIESISPSELAGRILRYAIEEAGGRVRDDMTVLAVGIWERREKQQN